MIHYQSHVILQNSKYLPKYWQNIPKSEKKGQ